MYVWTVCLAQANHKKSTHACLDGMACVDYGFVAEAYVLVFGLQAAYQAYSTVTDLAKLRGLSTSVPRAKAAW